MGDQPPQRPPKGVFPASMQSGGTNPPSLPPSRPQFGDIQYLPYFHPNLSSMPEVKGLMLPHILKDGSFLVRISTSAEKTYTVSVCHHRAIKHFKILRKNHQYYLQNHLFDSLQELITYYKANDVPNTENIENVRLLFPIVNKRQVSRSNSDTSMCRTSAEVVPNEPRYTGQIGRRNSSEQGKRNSDDSSKRSLSERGKSISSMGSSVEEEEDPQLVYNKLFPIGRSAEVRQLPPPPGSKLIPKQAVPQTGVNRNNLVELPLELRPLIKLDQRPPAPLPTIEDTSSGDSNGIYNGVYYSCVKLVENKLPQLIDQLSVTSATETTHCECGLDLELSQLPMGWSVHVSREAGHSYGRPFFVSPDQVTSWDPPKEIYLELNRHQQKFIKFLCDNYEKGNPPPDENTQIEWSSSSSDSHSGHLRVTQNPGGASSADRDSTGSNTGASHGALMGRGFQDEMEQSGAEAGV